MLSVALTCHRPHFEVSAAFDVRPGELLGLLGPSGAGKSTLLAAIAGLLTPRSGTVTLDGRLLTRLGSGPPVFVPPWRRQVGLVTQEALGFPHLTVVENLAYGLPGGQLDASTRALAETFGIGHLLDRPTPRLSGGERRRVALAQTLATRPCALLLDEPFAALDAPVRSDLSERVRDLLRRDGLPGVLVSHDLLELQRWCDRIGVLVAGALLQVAAPAALVARPAQLAVARLVGYTGQLPGRLVGCPDAIVAVHPDRTLLGAFPDRGPVLTARVLRRSARGAGWLLQAVVEGTTIEVGLPSAARPPEEGETIAVTLLSPPRFPEVSDRVPIPTGAP